MNLLKVASSLFIVGALFVGCLKRSQSKTEYAVLNDSAEGKVVVLEALLSGRSRFTLCIINEDPKANALWVMRVEYGFRYAFEAWLKIGSSHPKFPLPKTVDFDVHHVSAQSFVDQVKLVPADRAVLLEHARKLNEAMSNPSDEVFRKAILEFGAASDAIAQRSFVTPACPSGSLRIFSLVDLQKLRELLKQQKSKLELPEIEKFGESEPFMRRVVKVLYNGTLSYEDYKKKEDEAARKDEELTRAFAKPKLGEIHIHHTSLSEVRLEQTLRHEVGHLFGLGDVYVESGFASALQKHPPSLMGNHYDPRVNGQIQEDDRQGLLATITIAKSKTLKCGEGYEQFDNSRDPRSTRTFYCLPTSIARDASRLSSLGLASAFLYHEPAKCPAGMTLSRPAGVCCPASAPKANLESGGCEVSDVQ